MAPAGGAVGNMGAGPKPYPSLLGEPLCEHGGCWPQGYILGAQKSATTSIFGLLEKNGLVCGRQGPWPKGSNLFKEAHFYDADSKWNVHPVMGLLDNSSLLNYTRSYKKADCHATFFLDATPSYLRSYDAAQRMGAIMPDNLRSGQARLLIILREPIARDMSFYNMLRGEWVTQGSKGDVVEGQGSIKKHLCGTKADQGIFPSYAESVGCFLEHWHKTCLAGKDYNIDDESAGVETEQMRGYRECSLGSTWTDDNNYNRMTDGMYAAQLPRYSRVFPRSHIMVLQFDTMLSNQDDSIQRILGFYGFPAKSLTTLKVFPTENHQDFIGKVEAPACETQLKLRGIFNFWNKLLYKHLDYERKNGKTPDHEPEFQPFLYPTCGDKEEHTGDDAADAGAKGDGAAKHKKKGKGASADDDEASADEEASVHASAKKGSAKGNESTRAKASGKVGTASESSKDDETVSAPTSSTNSLLPNRP